MLDQFYNIKCQINILKLYLNQKSIQYFLENSHFVNKLNDELFQKISQNLIEYN